MFEIFCVMINNHLRYVKVFLVDVHIYVLLIMCNPLFLIIEISMSIMSFGLAKATLIAYPPKFSANSTKYTFSIIFINFISKEWK